MSARFDAVQQIRQRASTLKMSFNFAVYLASVLIRV